MSTSFSKGLCFAFADSGGLPLGLLYTFGFSIYPGALIK